jgi:uncharacterized protein
VSVRGCSRSERAFALLALAFAALLAFGALPARAADVPFLTGRVVDNAEILSAATRERLAAVMKAHEEATGEQIAVLTIPTIGGESVEEFATRVFESWKLGQKGKDNGVLVVIVPKDRKMRIEVGYGLEGTLTDVAASRIIRNAMTPQFKAGNYDKGTEDGVLAVIAQLKGLTSVADAASLADTDSGSEGGKTGGNSSFKVNTPDMPWPMRILLGCFIFGIIGLFTVIGVMTPGVGWFLYVFLIPFWAMFPLMIIGMYPTLAVLVTYIVGYPIAKLILARSPWYEKAARELKTKGSTTIGGFTMSSGGSSGSSSSSSSGSGGFSGGGGSSGGGGASGSW